MEIFIKESEKTIKMVQKAGSEHYRFSLDQQASELLAQLESESPLLYQRVLEQARSRLERITEEAKAKGRIIQTDSVFNKLTYLRNELVVREALQTFVYVGEAIDLSINGSSIRGKAELTKFEREERIDFKKKLVWRFLPKIEIQEVPFLQDKLLWAAVANESKHHFLFNGELTGYWTITSYKRVLEGNAADQGISLSRQLIDAVFAPVEEQIMKMYQQAVRK